MTRRDPVQAGSAADAGDLAPIITVVGSVNMDLVVGVPRHPAPGETLIGSDYVTHPGGKGANQAVAAARLGARVRFVGRVGSDAFGAELRQTLAADLVDVAHLGVSNGSSGVAFIQVDERGQNSIVVSPGANFAVTPADLADAAFQDASALVLQLEVPLEVVIAAARKARQRGMAVILNLAPAERLTKVHLQDVTHLVVNEYEAGLLLSTPSFTVTADPENAAKRLLDLVPQVVITLGDQGAVWATKDADDQVTTGSEAAFAVKAVDTTGAGDSFTGAFALAIARTRAGGPAAAATDPAAAHDPTAAQKPAATQEPTAAHDPAVTHDPAAAHDPAIAMAQAVRFASAAGALATTKPGAQPSLPRRQEVERMLAGVQV